ncbi:MAG: hypothetical protein ACPHCV_08115, partial [Pseudohongiellaceae bacterium]
ANQLELYKVLVAREDLELLLEGQEPFPYRVSWWLHRLGLVFNWINLCRVNFSLYILFQFNCR